MKFEKGSILKFRKCKKNLCVRSDITGNIFLNVIIIQNSKKVSVGKYFKKDYEMT